MGLATEQLSQQLLEYEKKVSTDATMAGDDGGVRLLSLWSSAIYPLSVPSKGYFKFNKYISKEKNM